MSATKVLDLAEKQGLLDAQAIAALRKQVAESRFVVTPEAIAKVLVDHGHLTPFQARKLVASALGEPAPTPDSPAVRKAPVDKPVSKPAARPTPPANDLDLGFADASEPSTPATDDEEEVVMLEPVAPAVPKPAAVPPKPKAPSPVKPAPKPQAEIPKPTPKPTLGPKPAPAPVAPPPADDIVDLELLPPPAGGPVPQPTAAPLAPPVDLMASPPLGAMPGPAPLSDPFLEPLGGGMAGLQTLDALDPLAGPAEAGAQPGADAKPKKEKKGPKNVWDSPLLLIGGGTLGVLIITFVALFYALTRGSAAEMFAKAEEDYRSGSYTSALAVYEQFLKNYPDDPSASLARVRRGMAQLRQVTDAGKNPRLGLQTAKTVLPAIESEEKFAEARSELSTILPDIADGFATQAAATENTLQREELVQLAGQAFELVNNPAYIPASLRKDRENRIAGIQDKLKAAQRSIDQDKDLAIAVGKIAEAEGQGDAATAYQVRNQLLKTYPALEASPLLLEAVRKVGDKERQLVKIGGDAPVPATDDLQPAATRVVLAVRTGPAPAQPVKIAFVLVEGAAYGLDVASGKVLWRRHVGYETTIHPQAVSREDGADALVVDSRRHELLRLGSATGNVVWRLPIGQAFFAPVLSGGDAVVTTAKGQLLKVDLASGNVVQSAQLPQGAGASAAIEARPPRLVQLGQHSTIFVLSPSTLSCGETYYLGHKAGAILVPPVTILEHIVAFESPADDHTLLHVLAPAGESKRLTPVGQPLRLKGRVVSPAAVAGRRVAVATDLGQIVVYEIDPSDAKQPLRQIAALEPSERTPTMGYYTADTNRLWLTSRRATLIEIQSSLQQLGRKWTLHQDDAFLAPPQIFGETLLHVRRRPGAAAVIVEGCQAGDGKAIWTTQLAVPVVSLVAAEPRPAVDAITSQGRVFTISSPQLQARYVDTPVFPLPATARGAILPDVTRSRDGKLAAWTEPQPGGRLYSYDVSAGTAPATLTLANAADEAATAAVLWGGKLLVPVKSGKVELLDPATGKGAALPFMPTLQPDRLPTWTSPAVLGIENAFVIGDGLGKLYRVAVKDQPQPHLAMSADANIDPTLQASLATAGDTVFGLIRSDAGDTVVAIDPQSLAAGASWPLTGRALLGPAAVEDRVFVYSETDGLLCLTAGQKLAWQRPLSRGPLAGPPVAVAGGDLILLFQSGTLARVAGDTGEELAADDLAEPLGRTARPFGQRVFVATSDGTLLLVPLPQRPQ